MPTAAPLTTLVLEAARIPAPQRRRLPRPVQVLAAAAEPGYVHAAALVQLCGGAVPPGADVPVAAICAAADIGPPGADFWLRADPVVLMPTRVELRLYADHVPELDAAQAAQALAWLAAAQIIPGARWHAPRPQRWYLRLDAAALIRTTPPLQLLGRNVQDDLPRGPDGGAWRAYLNAVQMALAGSPVNDARDRHGQTPLGSLWFWGGGTAPAFPARSFDVLAGEGPLLAGLALLSGAQHLPELSPQATALNAYPRRLVLPGAAASAWLQALRTQAGVWDVVVLEDTGAVRYRLAPRRWWRPWGF